MSVDLHLHSTYSDGTSTPTEIVTGAVAAGLTAIALTDHDTLEGIPEARRAAAAAGIHLVAGTELSVLWRSQSMHLLVYFLEPGPGPLQEQLGQLQEARADRNAKIVTKLNDLGLNVSLDEVHAEAGAGVVGRPHFAGVMMAKGYVTTVAEAFDRYLADGRPAYAPRRRLSAEEAIKLSRSSAAVPVVAHPHTLHLRAAEFSEGFAHLVQLGLGGIESYYGEYTPELRQRLADICHSLGIVATGGSDYHGSYKPHLEIGTGKGDLRVPDRVFDQLVAARR
jgi:predicted metal-dependent phosphoesterase TrpH